MKLILKFFSLAILTCLLNTACNKVGDLPYYDYGKAVTLTASTNAVALTPADSAKPVVSLSWTDPKYSTDSNTVKYTIEIDSAGRNFSQTTTRIVTANRHTSFTGQDLNNMLLDYGFALGAPTDIDIRVISSYGNNNERYTSNVVTISVTPYSIPSVFKTSATSSTGSLATASQNALTFSWTPAFKGYTGPITYAIQFDSAGNNFSSPHTIAVGTNMYNKPMTKGEINQNALDEAVKGGTIGKLEYRLKAMTALGAVAISNVVTITIHSYVSILRVYMPGNYQTATGNGTDWTPANAPEMIRDTRAGLFNKMYYTYIYLPAATEFKFTVGRDWAVNYGAGTNGSLGGNNITVPNAGVYRVTLDLDHMTYNVMDGRMGFVGGATGAGWNPPNVFPNYGMAFASTNLFIGVSTFTADGWKMIDNDSWNNGSNTADETRSYGSTGPAGSSLEVNGANMPNIPTAGKYRVIWDGRDVDNIKYDLMAADEMRIVGDGIQGVNAWDPGSSPQMTYMGNGKWQLRLNLIGGKDIKFLAGNAWGAFDYEDAGDNGTAGTTIRRKLKWEGGDNFKTPATSGSYLVTLNESTQTMTITP